VRTIITVNDERVPLNRALARVGAVDAQVAARGLVSGDLQRERFVAELLTRADDYPHDDPTAAAYVVFRIAFGAIVSHLMLGGYEPVPNMTWETVVNGLADACVAHLTHAVPTRD
jgi:hypothetical protein